MTIRTIAEFVLANPEWKGHEYLVLDPPDLNDWPELDWNHPWNSYVNPGVTRLAHYIKMRRCGESHDLAEMCALQMSPKAETDREFFAGIGSLESQFGGEGHTNDMDQVIATAKRHGYKPNLNDVYVPGLASFRGDPKAFVPPTGGRGHIKRVCEQRGWECEGTVKTKYREPERDPVDRAVPLAEDLIRKNAADALRKDPSLKRNPRALRQQVIEKHSLKK